jgi:hypothetical protein
LEAEAHASSRSVVSLAQDVVDRTLVWRDGALRQA